MICENCKDKVTSKLLKKKEFFICGEDKIIHVDYRAICQGCSNTNNICQMCGEKTINTDNSEVDNSLDDVHPIKKLQIQRQNLIKEKESLFKLLDKNYQTEIDRIDKQIEELLQK